MKHIGFVGPGIMGRSMIRNLKKAGFEVTVWARRPEQAAELVAEGIGRAETLAECAQNKDAVITMVGFPADVREVYFSPQGILAHARKGTLLIDMTTTQPSLAEEIYAAAREKGLRALDAPVTGGDAAAKAAQLTIMAGGDARDYQDALPLFRAMGKTSSHMGRAGSGQHTKMANQIAIAGAMAGMIESLRYAQGAHLPLKQTMDLLRTGSGGSTQMEQYADRLLAGDLEPGFFIKHFVKDMGIAQKEAEAAGVDLPMLTQVLSMYNTLIEKGYENKGTHALIKYYTQED